MVVFTVFTATYNRAHTLDRVFRALSKQTFRDFEWVVVDDGSTDGTAAKVDEYGRAAAFPVVCARQANSGKHVAHNRAAGMARGELFVVVDSDDEPEPCMLERLHAHWSALPAGERKEFLGVGCLCRDAATGEVIGRRTPPARMNALEYVLRNGIDYDIAACVRTDLVRAHPYPAPDGVRFLPDALVWNRIMRDHRIVMTDEVLKTVHYEADGFTRNVGRTNREHGRGRRLYYLANVNENADIMWKHRKVRYFKDLIQLGRMTFHARAGVARTFRDLRGVPNKLLFLLLLPLGWGLSLRD